MRRIAPGLFLHAVLGQGGMATVHFGEERTSEGSRVTAVKQLRPQLARDPDFAAMFLDEARIAERVRDPRVVASYGVIDDGGELFLNLEYVAGAALSAALAKGRAPLPIAVAVMRDALLGLHAAHEATDERGAALGIVHRDVSPQNILVGEDGVARLTDFGVARAAARFHATTPGQMKGKLRYMAPEQLKGAIATPRCDVYAAAVVLWEALTGQRLVRGDSYAEIFGQALEGIVRPPSAVAAVPKAIDAVVMRGLARDPSARFATAREMATALAEGAQAASPIEVGAWLRACVGDDLARRRQIVAAILLGVEPHGALPARAQEADEETPTLPRGPSRRA